MTDSNEEARERVIATLRKYSGKRDVSNDAFIGRDLGITGGDSVEFLDEIEEKFGIDLAPLIDARKRLRPADWLDRLLGRKHGGETVDLTVSEVVDHVLAHRTTAAK